MTNVTPSKLANVASKQIETNLGPVRLFDTIDGDDTGYALAQDGRAVRVNVQIDRAKLSAADRATLTAWLAEQGG